MTVSRIIPVLAWSLLAMSPALAMAIPTPTGQADPTLPTPGVPVEAGEDPTQQAAEEESTALAPAEAEPAAASAGNDTGATGAAQNGGAAGGAGGAAPTRPRWFYVALAIFLISTLALLARMLLGRSSGRSGAAKHPKADDVQDPSASAEDRPSTPRFSLLPESNGTALVLELSTLGGRNGFCIGRNGDFCDMRLGEEDVSRRHARFAFRDEQLTVEDLNSSHGTLVNERRITPFSPVSIAAGDRVMLSRHAFTVMEART